MGIILGTIYFYFLIWFFGDNHDGASRWKSFLIVLAGGIVQAVCLFKFPELIGPAGALLLATGAMVMLLVTWCRTSLLAALKIVGCFLAGTFVYELGVETLATQAMA